MYAITGLITIHVIDSSGPKSEVFSYLMFSSALPFSGSAEENSVTNQKGTKFQLIVADLTVCVRFNKIW
jgi:hypothetical protein